MHTEATEKQLVFIRAIEDKTGHLFNFNNASKQQASIYISKHIDEYKKLVAKDPFYYSNQWALVHGYE